MRRADCNGAVLDESDTMQVVARDTFTGDAAQPCDPAEAH